MGFILAAWGGPGMITKDFANHSVQLYLSRPISRTEYLFGKVSVLAALLSCITWIPALMLFFVKAELQGHGWLWDNLWMAGSIVLSCLDLDCHDLPDLNGCGRLGEVAHCRHRSHAGNILPSAGARLVLDAILRTQWGMLLNFTHHDFAGLGAPVPRGYAEPPQAGFDVVPLWAAWASLLSVCAFCFWLLDRKLRAREVERS